MLLLLEKEEDNSQKTPKIASQPAFDRRNRRGNKPATSMSKPTIWQYFSLPQLHIVQLVVPRGKMTFDIFQAVVAIGDLRAPFVSNPFWQTALS